MHRLWDHAVPAACFAKLVEQLQSFSVRDSVVLQALRPVLAFGEGRYCGKTHLVHLADSPLNFWFWISQKLEKGGDPWEKFSTAMLPLCPNVRKLSATMRFPPFWVFKSPNSTF